MESCSSPRGFVVDDGEESFSVELAEKVNLLGADVRIRFGGWAPDERPPSERKIQEILAHLGLDVPLDRVDVRRRTPMSPELAFAIDSWWYPFPEERERHQPPPPLRGDAIGGVHPLHTESR